jgi:zinc ribbon protein
MLGALLLGLGFGAVAAIAAHSRGRSMLGWLLAGMVIGPFALIVTLLPAVPRRGITVACPRCAEVISSEAEMCRHCGTMLLDPPRRAARPFSVR